MLDETKSWIKVEERLPSEGQLCIVYFPVGQNTITEKTIGPSATAYYRKNEGWIYADTPIKLRFKPYYWFPLDIDGIPISKSPWRAYVR